jgi:hypothetical protein
MKKVFTGFSVVFLCTALLGSSEELFGQQHFSWTSNTGNNAHVAVLLESEILIDGEPIQPGDEIGVFTPDALCVGGLVWDGERNRSIAVWQDNTMTPDVVDGIRVGEVMHFRLWRNSTGIEYSDVTVTYSLGDSIYTTNGMYVIESMIAGEPKNDDPDDPEDPSDPDDPEDPTDPTDPGEPEDPKIPQPIFPFDESIEISINTTLLWQGTGESSLYHLQLAANDEFENIFMDEEEIADTTYTVKDLTYTTDYFWRVRAHTGNEFGEWSSVFRFTTEDRPPPVPPQLVSPIDHAIGVSITPTMRWESVPGSVSYALQIFSDDAFMTPIQIADDVADTSYIVDELEYEQQFFWRVQSKSEQSESEWSELWSFTTKRMTDTLEIQFEPGWNLISSNIQPDNCEIRTLFADMTGNFALVKDVAGKVHWPGAGIFELDSWTIESAYSIYMYRPDSLQIVGTRVAVAETPIELTQGWNVMAHLPETAMPVVEALSALADNVRMVKTMDGRLFWPDEGINNIGYMEPGVGYYIYVNEPTIFYYPESTEPGIETNKVSHTASAYGHMETHTPSPRIYKVPVTNTGAYASILFKVDRIRDESEIGVWNRRRELVGSGVVKNGRALVTIWGDNEITTDVVDGALDQEELSLTVWSSWNMQEYPLTVSSMSDFLNKQNIDEGLVYRANSAFVAVAEDPLPQFPVNYNLAQNFPNPFNPSTTIRYTIPERAPVKLEVYNMLGQLIDVLVDEEQFSGYHEVVFHRTNLASGVYIYRLQAGYFVETRRMIILK